MAKQDNTMLTLMMGIIAVIILLVLVLRYMPSIKNLFSLPTAAPVAAEITTAEQLMATGELNVGDAGGLVIWIPNEAHEPPGEERLAPERNGAFLPEKAIIGTGCEVVWISDDATHDHTIEITGMSSTGSFATDAYSEPVVFTTAGSFATQSTEYSDQVGSIEVTATAAVPGVTAGAVFAPNEDLAAITSTLTGAGLEVLSSTTFPASGGAEGETACIVYMGPGTATEVAEKLTAVTKATPYS